MTGVDWPTVGAIAGFVAMAMGFQWRLMHREFDQVRTEVVGLRDAYMRHLEHHATR